MEAARAGYIFAHNGRAYGQWRSRQAVAAGAAAGGAGAGLAGADLERVIVAMLHTTDVVTVRYAPRG